MTAPAMSSPAELVDCRSFGRLPSGEDALLFTLRNRAGVTVRISNFGATLVSILTPDRQGGFANILLGYDDLDSYVRDTQYLGATIGRYANRIANAEFTLDGVHHRLQANDGTTCLHGGAAGFGKKPWKVIGMRADEDGAALVLSHVSPHLDGGFPGELHADATFSLDAKDTLTITLRARTDRDTVVSLTGHAYFNLTGRGGHGSILEHELQIAGDAMLPIDARMIPTGERRAVRGTAFDFLAARPIGQRIGADDEQLKLAGGYDHCWLLNPTADEVSAQVSVHDPGTGRVLELACTTPGLQFYSGNFLDGRSPGKNGQPLNFRSGFCIEPEQLPDAPNQPAFPSTVLKPGEEYRSEFSYRFGIRN